MNENERQNSQKKKEENTLQGVVCTCSGDRMAPVYKRVYDEKTKRNLVLKVDETDLFEFIQASKSQTDLAVLQKRFLELGEIPSADPSVGSNDLAVFPSDIHGVYDMVNNVEANFKRLPQSVQAVFGDSETYLKALLDGTYQATLVNAFNQQKNDDKQDDKKEGNE